MTPLQELPSQPQRTANVPEIFAEPRSALSFGEKFWNFRIGPRFGGVHPREFYNDEFEPPVAAPA
jgi:hypothetical protein